MTPRTGSIITAAELQAMRRESRRAMLSIAIVYWLGGLGCGSLATVAWQWAIARWWS
jgi:hypothetical protein